MLSGTVPSALAFNALLSNQPIPGHHHHLLLPLLHPHQALGSLRLRCNLSPHAIADSRAKANYNSSRPSAFATL